MPEESTTPYRAKVAAVLDAASRRDLDAVVGAYTGDAIYDMGPIGVGTFRGRRAIYTLYADWLAAYEEIEFEIEEMHDFGNGVTFDVVAHQARPLGSRGTVNFRQATILTWNDDLIQRQISYQDIDEARVAAEQLAKERG